MKNLKTTIKLSVLVLACLGAGALALQPTAYAQADTTNPADCLTMANGASVSVKDDFSGIRWETKINYAKYAALKEANPNAKITFGTLVMPTNMLSDDDDDDGVLTDADIDENSDKGALVLSANVDYANLSADTTYYSVVDFNDVAEDKEAAAYAMELTARSYVKIDDAYYFVDLGTTNTSRSARQVALSAELDGDLDKMESSKATKAAGYYGTNGRYEIPVVNTGAVGTTVLDLEALATKRQTININLDLPIDAYDTSKGNTGLEVMIGAQRMTDRVVYKPKTESAAAAFAFYVPAGTILPEGEKYVSVFLPNGDIYTYPIICATKVLTTKDDLAIFNAKGGYYDLSTKVTLWDNYGYWRPEQEQGGYYVLGGNIDATGYVHGSRIAEDAPGGVGKDGKLGTDDDVVLTPGDFNNASWNGAGSYVDKPIGLTGTFNGMGYTIDGMTIGSQREGFFGIVNGGTVKNVAFNDVKGKVDYNFVIANYLINATIDNVFIAINEYDKNDKVNNPGYAINDLTGILGAYAINDTKLSNIFIRLNSQSTATATFGALFGSMHSDESYTCDNVFVYGRTHFKYVVGTTAKDETTGVETTTYGYKTLSYCAAMVTASHASGPKDESGDYYTSIDQKGTLYLAENQVVDADAKELTAVSASISTDVYNLKVIKGVYLYTQSDKGHVTGTWADHDYANFFASGCWKANSKVGVLWKNL